MRIIKLQDKFILVSDEEIKEGDNYIVPHNVEGHILSNIWVLCVAHKNFILNYYMKENKNWWFKVMAKNPDFSLLSEEDCLKIGFMDVEKLAEHNSEIQEATYTLQHKITYKHGFIDGFNTVQTLSDKRFSLEDMSAAIAFGFGICRKEDRAPFNKEIISFIQSLQQTEWNVEVNELNQITKIL